MSLRFLKIQVTLLTLSLSTIHLLASSSFILNEQDPSIHVDFDDCVSYFGGYNEDYSEFTGSYVENADCSVMELIGGFVYRRNPSDNTHSCTPGVEDAAMCISGLESCDYVENNDRALRFEILVMPGSNGFGSIKNIQFYSQAPEMFSFIDGQSGPNNYPTKMALRVLANGVEVFRQTEIETQRIWTLNTFDFTSVVGFSVQVPTLFSFEILPYCLVGIESDVMAWDIDELTINGGCNDINGGLISVVESSEICYPDSLDGVRSFTLDLEIGSQLSWIIVDSSQMIIDLPDTSSYDFSNLENGVYTVYHISYDSNDFSGLEIGNFLKDIQGCFDLSNPIEIFNNRLEGGELSSDDNSSLFICNDDQALNLIDLNLDGSVGLFTEFLLLDTTGMILLSSDLPVIDISSFGEGLYHIIAVTHNGNLVNAQPGSNLDSLMGCFALSNLIDVEKMQIDAGQISFDGQDNFQACATSSFELNPTLTDTIGGNSRWVLFTPNGMIVGIFNDTPIDVGMMLFPTLRLVHLSFLGNIEGLELGEDIDDLVGCFDVSNILVIDIPTVEGGMISSNGSEELSICVNDPVESMVEVQLQGASGTAFSFVVTDEDGVILSIPGNNIIDFSNGNTGLCFIWNIAFVNNLQGFSVGQNIENIVGCYDLSNSISVNRIELQPAEISLESGETSIEICSGDGNSDSLIIVTSDFEGVFSSLVITDDQGMILEVPQSDTIDFEGVVGGLCFIYHLVASNDSILNGNPTDIDSLVGCYELSNAISVQRNQVNGGTIATVDSLTEVFFIIGDNISDELDAVITGAVGSNMSWIVTDTLGEILALPDTLPFDFSGAGAGVCYVWNISYSGVLDGLEVGQSVDSLAGCFAISNAITVNRVMLNGGVISFDSGGDTLLVCLGDPIIDSLDVSLMNFEGPLSSWVITDTSGVILDLPDGPPFVFDAAGAGLCQIWHISYTMGLLGLEIGQNVSDITGSFNLSNSLYVERVQVDGGVIMTTDSLTVVSLCTGDGMPDVVELVLDSAIGENSSWIVTDTSGIILNLTTNPVFEFDSVAAGTCIIYHISYLDTLNALQIDSSINNLTGCYDLSNTVTVNKFEVDGGIIAESSGMDTINVVVGEGIIDSFEFSVIDEIGDSLVWIVTDSSGLILYLSDIPPVDFESSGEGICFVYHMSYGSGIQGLNLGNNLIDIVGCFDLSNAITIVKTEVNGGVISSIDSLTIVNLCYQDILDDSLQVILNGAQGTEFQWIITDTSGVILDLPSMPPFDLSSISNGICQVWHLASIGSVGGLMLGENISDLSGVFDLSNSIQVFKEQVDGGTLSHLSGLDTLYFITNDGIPDSVDLNVVGIIGDSTQWVVTNEMGIILSLPDSLPIDFEGTEPGVCLIWNIAYNSMLEGLEIDSSAFDLVGCFDFSNPITVIREHISGGTIMTTDSLTTLSICLNDTITDLVDVVVVDTSGMNFSWVITDTAGLILDLPVAPPFDLESAGVGLCQIWHLAYQDNLMGLAIGNNVSDLTGFFDFSNDILVAKDSLDGGMITLLDGSLADTITVGDGVIDSIEIVLTGSIGDNVIYLVTDTLGEILDTSSNNIFTFENAGGGVCLIWALSYSDFIDGLEISNNVSDLSGCFDLSNSVTITRMGLMGGNLITSDSLDFVQICLSDTIPDEIDVILTDTNGPIQTWVLTDTDGIILDLPMSPPFDLSSQTVDTCYLWNLSHEMGILGLGVGLSIDSLVGNFNFSNSITIEKVSNSPSVIMTTDSLTSVTITVGEGTLDLITVVSEGGEGDSSIWVVTDALNNIVALQDSSSFDFESSGGGTCFIWEIHFEIGLEGLELGANFDDIIGCFSLSNDIEVNKIPTALNGGVLTTDDFETAIEICVGNGMTEQIDVILNFNVGPNFQWVITDTSGLILGLPTAPPFDLSLAGAGMCQIWNLSYSNGLTGLNVGSNISGLMGFFDFSNAISVVRNVADGGEIETTGGLTEITIPVGEGVIDSVDLVIEGAEGNEQTWVITDTNNVIMTFGLEPPFTFENDGGGRCLVWNLSSSGEIMGLEVGNNISSITGCFDFSNSVLVIKDGPNGGVLSDINGNFLVEYCNSNQFSDSIEVILTDTLGSSHQWFLVDTSAVILNASLTAPFDLSGIPIGTCFIYNMAYETAPTGISIGDTILNAMGTYHLSNPLQVEKVETFGGTLTFADTTVLDTIVVGEGIIDTVEVLLNGNLAELNQWVVTDTFGVILSLPVSDPFNFEDAGGGVCLIWNLAYQSGLQGLSVGNNVSELDGCYDFSNSITLVRDGLNGGLLRFDDMTTQRDICFGDGIPDFTSYVVQGSQGNLEEFFFARTNGQLLVLNAPNPFNFEVIPANIDTFLIYNMAYDTLPMGYTQGSFISNMTGNFALSNPIFLIRDIQKGGSIVDTSGLTASTVIVADGVVDTLELIVTNTFADSMIWVTTNDSDTIVALQQSNEFVLDSLGDGICNIYHIGFNPSTINGLEIGQHIDSISGCFGRSNAYVLTKKALNGGFLSTTAGETSLEICSGDNEQDVVNLITEGEIGSQFVFIIANLNGIILLNQTSSQINLTSIQPGMCQIFNISHDGSLGGLMNGVNISSLTGCFLLSNPIDVNKTAVFGGNLSLQSGGTEEDVCVGDAIDDNVIWQTTSLDGEYIYAITDTFNVIDTLITNPTFDFNNSEVGVCRIWGISYVGTLVAQQGDTIGVTQLVEDCFDVSNNFITVNKNDCSQPAPLTFKMYPNPVTDILRIDLDNLPRKTSSVQLFNSAGKVVYQTEVGQGMLEIDVNSFDSGMYYIRFKSGGFTRSDKFIILK